MASPRLGAGALAAATTLVEPRLCPHGGRVAWVGADSTGVRIVVAPVTGGEPTLVTEPAPRMRGGVFDWVGSTALAVAGADGGVWLVDLVGGAPRRLADGDATGLAVSPDGSRIAFVRDLRAICVVTTDGTSRVVDDTHDFSLDPAWSPDGARLAWHAWEVPAMPWDSSRILVAGAGGDGQPTAVAGGDAESVAQPLFLPDGRLAWMSDRSGWTVPWASGPGGEPASPLLDEPRDHAPPAWGSGIRSWAVSPDGARIAADRNVDGFGQLVIHEVTAGRSVTAGRGVHSSISWRGGRVAARRAGARTPDEVVVLDPATGERAVLARALEVPKDALVEPDVVTFPTPVGPAVSRLYAPAGARPPFPVIAWTHGGPHDQARVEWKHRIAFLVAQGWAVLCVDHRGTTGHGREWTQALRRQWGVVDVADTMAAIDTLVDRGLLDPARVVAAGSSAGGFTTLHLLARHPDRFAGGIALYPVTDLVGLQDATHRFEAHYNDSLVGPWPEAADLYRSRSPVTAAHQIRGPLLVLHGSDDEVVPVGQATDLVARVAAAGGEVDLKVFPGEGHGWHRPAVVAEELSRVGAFLDGIGRDRDGPGGGRRGRGH